MHGMPLLLNIFIALFFSYQQPDPCKEAMAGAARATLLAKADAYTGALKEIKIAFESDRKEHAVAFGKDLHNSIIAAGIKNGNTIGGTVPVIQNGFADLHNHPNNTPPDAGDLYGLIDINKSHPGYDTRFVLTPMGTMYVLLVTNPVAAAAFDTIYPRQVPAFPGGPPGFPVAMVDEFREMKYRYNCTDEMALAFILEKYHAGVSLLKQDNNGAFKKIVTVVTGEAGHLIFTASTCP